METMEQVLLEIAASSIPVVLRDGKECSVGKKDFQFLLKYVDFK